MSTYLKEALESELFITPWPLFINNDFIEGKKHPISDLCRKCIIKECVQSEKNDAICHNNYRYIKRRVGEAILVIPGIEQSNSGKRDKGLVFSSDSFNIWFNSLSKLALKFDDTTLKNKSEILHYFHDPVKWAEQIKINSEKLIESSLGVDFKEKFNNSATPIKSIYQSSKMLVEAIQMVGVFFNPESASYGKTIKTNVYKLFDKIQAIIYHSEGKKYNKRFKLQGNSFNELYLYESFPIIALAIVHNALKYSRTAQVDININDTKNGVEVEVISIGPIINDEEKEKVFHKFFRGKYAKRIHHDGSGVGLFVAQHVAKIHGFQIKLFSESLHYERDSIPMATNKFYFVVPTDQKNQH